jgi:hypothetical protein
MMGRCPAGLKTQKLPGMVTSESRPELAINETVESSLFAFGALQNIRHRPVWYS